MRENKEVEKGKKLREERQEDGLEIENEREHRGTRKWKMGKG